MQTRYSWRGPYQSIKAKGYVVLIWFTPNTDEYKLSLDVCIHSTSVYYKWLYYICNPKYRIVYAVVFWSIHLYVISNKTWLVLSILTEMYWTVHQKLSNGFINDNASHQIQKTYLTLKISASFGLHERRIPLLHVIAVIFVHVNNLISSSAGSRKQYVNLFQEHMAHVHTSQ